MSKVKEYDPADRVAQAVTILREDFESVQVLATRQAGPDETYRFEAGAGNFMTRYGHAKAFCLKCEANFAENVSDEAATEDEEEDPNGG